MNTNHPLQSKAWGKFRKSQGIDLVETNFGQITFHHVPHTLFTIGYFPKGPRPTISMVKELIKIGKQKNAIFIQLEPNILINHEPLTMNHGLTPSHHPLFTKYTFVLNLTKSEEELMKAMHPKTRYNIKLAQKHGVIIKQDNNAFNEYLRLTNETTKRQGFYAHNNQYHRKMWEIMNKADIASLWTASYNNEIIVAWIIFNYSDTIYYPYGASSRNHKEVMAPQLLLWEIAKWGKKNGFKKFDLWGAMGPNPDVKDPWYGFHRFKAGFNPQLIEFMGSFDLVINKPLYKLYTVVDQVRWFLLKIKKSF